MELKKIIVVVAAGAAIVGGGLLFMQTPGAPPQTSALTGDPTDPVQVAEGKVVYDQYCASCHGANLEGQPNWKTKKANGILPAPPHDESGHTWHHSDRLLFDYVKNGGAGQGLKDFKSGMPPLGRILSDKQIAASLAYIKSSWPKGLYARQKNVSLREAAQKSAQ